jgi:hypothetical protein
MSERNGVDFDGVDFDWMAMKYPLRGRIQISLVIRCGGGVNATASSPATQAADESRGR